MARDQDRLNLKGEIEPSPYYDLFSSARWLALLFYQMGKVGQTVGSLPRYLQEPLSELLANTVINYDALDLLFQFKAHVWRLAYGHNIVVICPYLNMPVRIL